MKPLLRLLNPLSTRNESIMQQEYERYSAEDFEVWQLLYIREVQQLQKSASATYFEGLKTINFRADEIPRFKKVNEKLQSLTQWELVVITGLIPDRTFFELLSHQKFPTTTWLRKKLSLDYLKEPDMFHDEFAHVPLLSDAFFVKFLLGLSQLGLTYFNNAAVAEVLTRIYWFTVESILIREQGQLKIYGAGILSSLGETAHCLSKGATRFEFDLERIMHLNFRKDVFQEVYFIISSYEHLYDMIPALTRKMNLFFDKAN
jgi:phenylalanine-4-hydroxylase